ncbi:hypothetical protein BDZ97DRAFT_1928155 [Flammula alnicola]|nr:hypothetical protein BDZ97DRAFT_1928155 [Flammula alnicola]
MVDTDNAKSKREFKKQQDDGASKSSRHPISNATTPPICSAPSKKNATAKKNGTAKPARTPTPATPSAPVKKPDTKLTGRTPSSSALLYAAPTMMTRTTRMNYGEGFNPSGSNDEFSISHPIAFPAPLSSQACIDFRPTIELASSLMLALNDLLFNDEPSSDNDSQFNAWSSKASDDNTDTDSTDSTSAASPKILRENPPSPLLC